MSQCENCRDWERTVWRLQDRLGDAEKGLSKERKRNDELSVENRRLKEQLPSAAQKDRAMESYRLRKMNEGADGQ